MFHLLMAITMILACSFKAPGSKPDLIITLNNIKDTDHDIYISVNKESDNFPQKLNMVKAYVMNPAGKTSLKVTVTDLSFGKYAVTVYQDINGNKKLDTGLWGVPIEPVAFSNNVHPRFSAPKWKDCEFDYNAKNNVVEINGLVKVL